MFTGSRLFSVALLCCVAGILAPSTARSADSAPARFDVVLKSFGESKIGVIKVVRQSTGLGLKETKDLVESAPVVVKAGLSQADADKLKAELEREGDKVKVTLRAQNAGAQQAGQFQWKLRSRSETAAGSGQYHTLTRSAAWPARETALIVCDMWDLHHCLNATRRVGELAPRMNQVLAAARAQGALIIHAPSSCMEFYQDHPGRKLAQSAPAAGNLPAEIDKWCRHIPEEDKGKYPVDQSDGGEDDDLAEHQQWAAQLTAMGRNPKSPWKRQIDLLEIAAGDAISDSGVEIWNLLEARGIKHVALLGVHTNMCVLGRPFGLRQMAKNGKDVALIRDMTDTMYNPARWPFVSHFTGTDLIVEHIEKFVCPTVSSEQLLGGQAFRFAGDKRPHLVVVSAEDEYKTETTLPAFTAKNLGGDFRVSHVFGSAKERNDLPGHEVVAEADVLLVSVRRRPLPAAQLELFRQHVAKGKPVVGIRTASHAFAAGRDGKGAEGFAQWPEFDADVLGGNYTNHHGNSLKVAVTLPEAAASDDLLKNVGNEGFASGGSLYKVSPLKPGARVLAIGRIEGQPEEPVAWTFVRRDGGRTFYTSLGHVDDFQQPAFEKLLANGIYWAAGLPAPDRLPVAAPSPEKTK